MSHFAMKTKVKNINQNHSVRSFSKWWCMLMKTARNARYRPSDNVLTTMNIWPIESKLLSGLFCRHFCSNYILYRWQLHEVYIRSLVCSSVAVPSSANTICSQVINKFTLTKVINKFTLTGYVRLTWQTAGAKESLCIANHHKQANEQTSK